MFCRIASCAVAAFVLVGCGTANHLPTANACGYAYSFQAGGKTTPSASCAGMIPSAPTKVTVSRGERFSIQIAHEQGGALDEPVPLPANQAVKLLSRHGAVIAYRAEAVGSVALVAHHARYCIGIDPRIGSCAAYRVHITR